MIDRRMLLVSAFSAGLLAGRRAFAATSIDFSDLYEKETVFSKLAESLNGADVEMTGFMAPPLKAESTFFVLTRMPMGVCPFCESAADWPSDIVVVYTEEPISVVPFNFPIRVSGRLELGVYKDEAMGFVSRVRLVDADFRRA
ncbi:hypothetical protein [Mesorhizobium sp. KR9-304]|uniref:hypothetical protein n=1 Tax=Mesorhizobium sp. KR9-304 TaxID=3156614 RepID=UPI0032B5CBD6